MGHPPRLAEADPVGRSRQARTKISDTLVEILGDTASDAGSTPAASTKPNLVLNTDQAHRGARKGTIRHELAGHFVGQIQRRRRAPMATSDVIATAAVIIATAAIASFWWVTNIVLALAEPHRC